MAHVNGSSWRAIQVKSELHLQARKGSALKNFYESRQAGLQAVTLNLAHTSSRGRSTAVDRPSMPVWLLHISNDILTGSIIDMAVLSSAARQQENNSRSWTLHDSSRSFGTDWIPIAEATTVETGEYCRATVARRIIPLVSRVDASSTSTTSVFVRFSFTCNGRFYKKTVNKKLQNGKTILLGTTDLLHNKKDVFDKKHSPEFSDDNTAAQKDKHGQANETIQRSTKG